MRSEWRRDSSRRFVDFKKWREMAFPLPHVLSSSSKICQQKQSPAEEQVLFDTFSVEFSEVPKFDEIRHESRSEHLAP